MRVANAPAAQRPARPEDVLLVAAAGAVALSALAAAVESVVRNRRLGLGPRLVLAVAVGAFPLSFRRPRPDDDSAPVPDQAAPESDLSCVHVHDEYAFDQTTRRYRIVDGIIIPFTRNTGGKWVPDKTSAPATRPRLW